MNFGRFSVIICALLMALFSWQIFGLVLDVFDEESNQTDAVLFLRCVHAPFLALAAVFMAGLR